MADRQRNPPRSEIDQKRLRPEKHPDPRSRYLNRQLRNKLATSPLDSAHSNFVRSYFSESKRFPAIDADVKQPSKRRLKDRKSTRLNSSHVTISYAVFGLK